MLSVLAGWFVVVIVVLLFCFLSAPYQAEKKKWCQSELPIGKGPSKLSTLLGKWLTLEKRTCFICMKLSSLSLCFCLLTFSSFFPTWHVIFKLIKHVQASSVLVPVLLSYKRIEKAFRHSKQSTP